MGRATRFLKALFGFNRVKQTGETAPNSADKSGKKKNRSFTKTGKDPLGSGRVPPDDPVWMRSFVSDSSSEQSRHAIAVAAATAAAAEAAVAAARAAAEAVRLTGGGGGGGWAAAVKIQAVFRGFLARKALRALKALVKLQAHIRGSIVRKRAAATLYSMQALIRAQGSFRARRASPLTIQPEIKLKNTTDTGHGFLSNRVRNPGLPESPKIVEIDTCRSRSRRLSNEHRSYAMSSPLPCQTPTIGSIPDHPHFNWGYGYGLVPEDCYKFATAQNTPRLSHSDRILNSPKTPAKSIYGDSFSLISNMNYPNYMTNTESFRAKVRCQSVPRQRVSTNEVMSRRSSFTGVRVQRTSWCHQVQQQEIV